jgi:hypothetical protein
MKIAYKFRIDSTGRNDWKVAIIINYSEWCNRSLKGKGLSDPQVIREATDIELKDIIASGTRLNFITYNNYDGFIEDEITCGSLTDEIKSLAILSFNKNKSK